MSENIHVTLQDIDYYQAQKVVEDTYPDSLTPYNIGAFGLSVSSSSVNYVGKADFTKWGRFATGQASTPANCPEMIGLDQLTQIRDVGTASAFIINNNGFSPHTGATGAAFFNQVLTDLPEITDSRTATITFLASSGYVYPSGIDTSIATAKGYTVNMP